MTVFETVMITIAFANLVLAILAFNHKKLSTLEFSSPGWIILYLKLIPLKGTCYCMDRVVLPAPSVFFNICDSIAILCPKRREKKTE